MPNRDVQYTIQRLLAAGKPRNDPTILALEELMGQGMGKSYMDANSPTSQPLAPEDYPPATGDARRGFAHAVDDPSLGEPGMMPPPAGYRNRGFNRPSTGPMTDEEMLDTVQKGMGTPAEKPGKYNNRNLDQASGFHPWEGEGKPTTQDLKDLEDDPELIDDFVDRFGEENLPQWMLDLQEDDRNSS